MRILKNTRNYLYRYLIPHPDRSFQSDINSASKNEGRCNHLNIIAKLDFLGNFICGEPSWSLFLSRENFLFRVFDVGVDVQTQTLGIQVQLVLATVLLQNLGNLTSILDLTQLDVTLALLDGITNEFGGTGLTLGADNEGLLLLAGLVDQESSTLGFLLGDLLGFDSGGEFRGEGQVLLKGTTSVFKHLGSMHQLGTIP